MSFAIHYESPGRLGSLNKPDYANLLPDFQYLAKHVFSTPNYMRIDGRPTGFSPRFKNRPGLQRERRREFLELVKDLFG